MLALHLLHHYVAIPHNSGLCVSVCVFACVFLNLQLSEYQNLHYTSKVRTFFASEEILAGPHNFKRPV